MNVLPTVALCVVESEGGDCWIAGMMLLCSVVFLITLCVLIVKAGNAGIVQQLIEKNPMSFRIADKPNIYLLLAIVFFI